MLNEGVLVNKIGIFVAAICAFAVAWPAESKIVIPPPAQVTALEPSTQTRPVEFTKVVVKLARGQTMGPLKGGWLCVQQEVLTWNGGSKELNPEAFADEFKQQLVSLGYEVKGGSAELFHSEDEGSEYLVGAAVDNIQIDLCFPQSGFGDVNTWKGSSLMSVEWQIYSRLDRKTVATIKTQGGFEQKGSTGGGAVSALLAAFAENVRALAASTEFQSIFVGKPTDLTVARPAPRNLARLPLPAGTVSTQKRTIQDAIGSTALIFAGDGFGSGFMISTDGVMLTNSHVVGAAKYVKVRWSDGIESVGEVIRSDRGRDVALIKTDPRARTPIPVRTSRLEVGENVWAVGTPVDPKLQSTVTKGVTSAIRVIGGFSYIQSDVNVIGGNSGGPLLDDKFQVVGLTVSGLQVSGAPVGINLFIPITDALDFLAVDFVNAPPK